MVTRALSQVRDVLSALSIMSRGVSHATRSAWKHSRQPLITCSAFLLLVALIPSVQVVAVGRLVDVLSSARPASEVVGPLLWVTAAVGLVMPLTGLAADMGQMLFASQKGHYGAELARIAANLSPAQLADAEVADAVKQARDALEGRAWLSRSVLQASMNVVTVTTLTASIWRISPLAGLMTLVALVPTTVGYSLVSKIEMAHWPEVSKHRKYGDYYLDQLVHQRSAVELVTLGTSQRMAALAGSRFVASARTLITIVVRDMRVELIAAFAPRPSWVSHFPCWPSRVEGRLLQPAPWVSSQVSRPSAAWDSPWG